jgi:hypothetical protein
MNLLTHGFRWPLCESDHPFIASPGGRDFTKFYSEDFTCFHGAVPINGVIYKNMLLYIFLIIIIIIIIIKGKGKVIPMLKQLSTLL